MDHRVPIRVSTERAPDGAGIEWTATIEGVPVCVRSESLKTAVSGLTRIVTEDVIREAMEPIE